MELFAVSRTINDFLLSTIEDRLYMILDEGKSEQLRTYLGESAYEEYLKIAKKTVPKLNDLHLGSKTPKNLIFIPGVMGSFLKSDSLGGIWWINLLEPNCIDKLRLNPNGDEDENPEYQINPCTIDNCYLAFTTNAIIQEDFGLDPFSYDWRKPINFSSSLLRNRIFDLYRKNGNRPVHLVAHSMGGLLVRATLMNYGQELSEKLGRIVFIGTPHYGSPQIASYLKNHLWGSDLLALLGFFLSRNTYRSLWGVLSMLPAPQKIYPGTRLEDRNKWESDNPDDSYIHPCTNFDMYQADNWRLDLDKSAKSNLQMVLDGAFDFHKKMYDAHRSLNQSFRDQMAVIAGIGFDTLFRIAYEKQFFGVWERTTKETKRIPNNLHREGDASVPLASASLEYVGDFRYVKGKHGELPNIPTVYQDVFRWLRGENMELPDMPSGALSSHLAGGTGTSETPNLDSTVTSNHTWDFEEPDSERLANLREKLRNGQLPEFARVRLL